MSIVIKSENQSKEYNLDQISSIGCAGSNGSGLYLGDGKIIDGNGVDVTDKVDTILATTIAEGDMFVEFEEE